MEKCNSNKMPLEEFMELTDEEQMRIAEEECKACLLYGRCEAYDSEDESYNNTDKLFVR